MPSASALIMKLSTNIILTPYAPYTTIYAAIDTPVPSLPHMLIVVDMQTLVN